MKKSSALLLAVLLFQVNPVQSVCGLSADSCGLNPPTILETPYFRQVCSTIFIALNIYKLDAIEGNSKEAIIREHGRALFDPDVRFDLNNIDKGRKGWTRYYPVAVGAQQFIVRIFLTGEKTFQPKMPVLFEMTIRDPAVTCQVLPGINSILESRRIRPLSSPANLSAADLSVGRSL